MDIYNAVGFVAFGALDITLYRRLAGWLGGSIERPWPWLAIAKASAALALVLGLRHSADYTWATLSLAWLIGGLLTVLWQAVNYWNAGKVNWQSKLAVAYLLGSFFSAFGFLGVKGTLAPDLATIGLALWQTALAAAASLVVTVLATIIYDAIENRLAER